MGRPAGRQAGSQVRTWLQPPSGERSWAAARRGRPESRGRGPGGRRTASPGWGRVWGPRRRPPPLGIPPGESRPRERPGRREPGRHAEGLAVQRFRLFRFSAGPVAEFSEFPPRSRKLGSCRLVAGAGRAELHPLSRASGWDGACAQGGRSGERRGPGARGRGFGFPCLEERKGAAGGGAGQRGAVSSLLGEMDGFTHALALESPPTRTCNFGKKP